MGYTKGPWLIRKAKDGKTIMRIGECSAEEYAGCSWLDVSGEDARLIAAAPCLLEALERVVACAYNVGGEHVTDHQPLIDAADFAMSIIARAKGEAE